MTKVINVIRIGRTDYRKCRVCKELKKLKANFYQKRNKLGNLIYEQICKGCRTKQFLQRYGKAKKILDELKSDPSVVDYLQDNDCGECVFLKECNYMVKVQKSEKNPYCFEDSKFHHRYLKEYKR